MTSPAPEAVRGQEESDIDQQQNGRRVSSPGFGSHGAQYSQTSEGAAAKHRTTIPASAEVIDVDELPEAAPYVKNEQSDDDVIYVKSEPNETRNLKVWTGSKGTDEDPIFIEDDDGLPLLPALQRANREHLLPRLSQASNESEKSSPARSIQNDRAQSNERMEIDSRDTIDQAITPSSAHTAPLDSTEPIESGPFPSGAYADSDLSLPGARRVESRQPASGKFQNKLKLAQKKAAETMKSRSAQKGESLFDVEASSKDFRLDSRQVIMLEKSSTNISRDADNMDTDEDEDENNEDGDENNEGEDDMYAGDAEYNSDREFEKATSRSVQCHFCITFQLTPN